VFSRDFRSCFLGLPEVLKFPGLCMSLNQAYFHIMPSFVP
jgi:hypothetical protein